MKGDINTVSFSGAEIKNLSVKKLASLDKEYKLQLLTADQSIILLDSFASDVTFKVTLEAEG